MQATLATADTKDVKLQYAARHFFKMLQKYKLRVVLKMCICHNPPHEYPITLEFKQNDSHEEGTDWP